MVEPPTPPTHPPTPTHTPTHVLAPHNAACARSRVRRGLTELCGGQRLYTALVRPVVATIGRVETHAIVGEQAVAGGRSRPIRPQRSDLAAVTATTAVATTAAPTFCTKREPGAAKVTGRRNATATLPVLPEVVCGLKPPNLVDNHITPVRGGVGVGLGELGGVRPCGS